MASEAPARRMRRCGCKPEDPWPPPRVPEAPPPQRPPAGPYRELRARRYALRGPQVEPEAAFWTLCRVPCVTSIPELVKRTDDPQA